jgi:hypothetical protein
VLCPYTSLSARNAQSTLNAWFQSEKKGVSPAYPVEVKISKKCSLPLELEEEATATALPHQAVQTVLLLHAIHVNKVHQ